MIKLIAHIVSTYISRDHLGMKDMKEEHLGTMMYTYNVETLLSSANEVDAAKQAIIRQCETRTFDGVALGKDGHKFLSVIPHFMVVPYAAPEELKKSAAAFLNFEGALIDPAAIDSAHFYTDLNGTVGIIIKCRNTDREHFIQYGNEKASLDALEMINEARNALA